MKIKTTQKVTLELSGDEVALFKRILFCAQEQLENVNAESLTEKQRDSLKNEKDFIKQFDGLGI